MRPTHVSALQQSQQKVRPGMQQSPHPPEPIAAMSPPPPPSSPPLHELHPAWTTPPSAGGSMPATGSGAALKATLAGGFDIDPFLVCAQASPADQPAVNKIAPAAHQRMPRPRCKNARPFMPVLLQLRSCRPSRVGN